jgi:hypothetical protein
MLSVRSVRAEAAHLVAHAVDVDDDVRLADRVHHALELADHGVPAPHTSTGPPPLDGEGLGVG